LEGVALETGLSASNSQTHLNKITNVPVYYMALGLLMISMGAIPLLGPLEGVGPENLDFFGPKKHSLYLQLDS
jgi:hypothetical protein